MMEPSTLIDSSSLDAELLPIAANKASRKRSKSANPILCFLQKPIREFTREELVLKPADNRFQENISNYRAGGFMRVELDQTIGVHKIVRKVGHGAFSTVWMGVDMFGKNKFAAIKIGKASRRGYDSIKKEAMIMKRMRSRDPNHPGYNFIVRLCRELNVHSSIGKHAVLVLQPVGRSLFELFQDTAGRGVNVEAGRSIAKQLLLGLTYIHDVCHMIHTDIKPGNVIIKGSDQYLNDMYDRVNKYRDLGKLVPRSYVTTFDYAGRENVARLGSADNPPPPVPPATRTRSVNKQLPLLLSPNIQVKISDVGNAVDSQPINRGIIQTPLYRSLEVYTSELFNYSSDVWSLGCLIFEVMTGQLLFSPNTPSLPAIDHVLLIYQMLKGAIPMHIRTRGIHVAKYFNPDGGYKRLDLIDKMESPQDILMKYMGWPEAQAEIFGDLISACINPDHNARTSAAALLEHKWFKDTNWFEIPSPAAPKRKSAVKRNRSHSI